MSLESRDVPQGTLVEVGGAFDAAEADRLHAVLRGLGPEQAVTLDFHRVNRFDDAAVVRLASEVAERHVALRGLSEHHHRLLRYMGLRNAVVRADEA